MHHSEMHQLTNPNIFGLNESEIKINGKLTTTKCSQKIRYHCNLAMIIWICEGAYIMIY